MAAGSFCKASMTPLIHFDQVTVTAQAKTLLTGINFVLQPGDKAVLCGKSGSGKSSILKTLLGLLTITAGKVYFQEQVLTAATVQHIRNCTAYIAQEPMLGADNVRDALLLPFQFKAHRDQRPTEAQLITVLQRLQLPAEILDRAGSKISGGEKQRVALARGLLLGKKLYLLDEVTSALDAESKQAVFSVFADPALTVLSVAHDSDWLACCDMLYTLDAGQLTQVQKHGNA